MAFLVSYIIWLIIDWYDCFVIDWIWVCHSKLSADYCMDSEVTMGEGLLIDDRYTKIQSAYRITGFSG